MGGWLVERASGLVFPPVPSWHGLPAGR